MRVLITGIGGFVGRYLARLCVQAGDEVHGILRPGSTTDQASFGEIADDIQLWEADLTDAKTIEETVCYAQPAYVYHLGGQAKVRLDLEEARAALDTNVSGTMHVLAAALKVSPRPRVLVVSSGQAYGGYDQQTALEETLPPFPTTEYGISKIGAELMAQLYTANHGLETVVSRSFNHTGPGQDTEFVCSAFAHQFAEIALGRLEPVLRTGRLDVYRDFTDVRDVVRAYVQLMERGRSGAVYNVCSGVPTEVGSLITMLQEVTGIEVTLERNESLAKKAGRLYHYGSCAKIRDHVGWEPEIDLRVTLHEMFEAWKQVLSSQH